MENASKALIMAGATLIAIIILTLLIYTKNQVADYQKSKYEIEKSEQVANFNYDFERYLSTDDDGISGADVVSLINKLSQYNKKASKQTSEDYDKSDSGKAIDYSVSITLEIQNIRAFKDKYEYNSTDGLFNGINGNIVISSSDSSALTKMTNMLNYNGDKNAMEVASKTYQDYKEKGDAEIQKAIGKALYEYNSQKYSSNESWRYGGDLTKGKIQNYAEYKEFMSSIFVRAQNTEYSNNNGQITKMYIKFNK